MVGIVHYRKIELAGSNGLVFEIVCPPFGLVAHTVGTMLQQRIIDIEV